MKKWQLARFEQDFELGLGLDIIEQRRADKYPTALPCIKKRRRVPFLIRNILRNCTRLCFLVQGKAVGYLFARLLSITQGFQQSTITYLDPIHLPLSDSNPKSNLKSSPKLPSCSRWMKKWQHARFELDFEPVFGLDIILQRRADRYPTALPCIKKRRRV